MGGAELSIAEIERSQVTGSDCKVTVTSALRLSKGEEGIGEGWFVHSCYIHGLGRLVTDINGGIMNGNDSS